MSPGRRQYLDTKRRHMDALLLFRMGDFYETFDDDAHALARTLDIALTARDVGGGIKAPLAGIPVRAAEPYIARLIRAGFKVAICEQTGDASTSKGIVDRAVVRIVTPGTVTEPGLLDQKRNNYLAAAVVRGDAAGLAYVDITTSEFVTSQFAAGLLADEVGRVGPAEVICDGDAHDALVPSLRGAVIRAIDPRCLDDELARRALLDHFKSTSLDAFGCEGRPLAVVAAAAVLNYLGETQFGTLPQVTTLRTQDERQFMGLDARALRDLEVFAPIGGGNGHTLFSVLDSTKTAMGGRLLREWVSRPLLKLDPLLERQAAVTRFVEASVARRAVRELLVRVPDLERLTNRVRTFSASPRELQSLGRGLALIPEIAAAVDGMQPGDSPRLRPAHGLQSCPDVVALISSAIAEDPPVALGDGATLRSGFDKQLDDLKAISGDARSRIADIESKGRSETGVKTLKVGFNRVFGYYIELSRTHVNRVPNGWERRQTLANAERFVTPELKEYEAKLLHAREGIGERERALFRQICGDIAAHSSRILASARALAQIDTVASLAEVAAVCGWIRPDLDDGETIEIKAGRHPTVEAALGPGKFVANDLVMSNGHAQILVITGPNMAGKSTYIRQAAVLVLLSQIGSYIPAQKARVGLVDRIFTRAGLGDDIAGGRSTFMTEMVETASVLNQATQRSLAVLDEIGRGTSTYDGLAIARAVAEHIHNSPRGACKTLFATHYHEITALAETLPRVVNLKVTVSEKGGDVVFLHTISPGGADKSYGIHVAKLAGLPRPVIARAREVLAELEQKHGTIRTSGARMSVGRSQAPQLQLFPAAQSVVDELNQLDLNALSPLEALNTLFKLQKQADQSL